MPPGLADEDVQAFSPPSWPCPRILSPAAFPAVAQRALTELGYHQSPESSDHRIDARVDREVAYTHSLGGTPNIFSIRSTGRNNGAHREITDGGILRAANSRLRYCQRAPQRIEAPISRQQQALAQQRKAQPQKPVLKRKIAIGRFTNETNYGRTLFRDQNLNPLGKQAADMLANRLVRSHQFLVFERPDISVITTEQKRDGEANLIGVDTLIVGSVTEFGRSVTGKSGFLSGTKVTVHPTASFR